ncbi:hypothetical protein HPB51_028847 [Rhipicephalus microplus]|uniref:RNA-dependent RNA polymerase n=1 Tax=Rhipicephalus microplus TaxID=6941 RepID=A0A9J6CW71_RHIMP|nr:hypothetical protein HPB51_028847 [Rhipicephalus microplus]
METRSGRTIGDLSTASTAGTSSMPPSSVQATTYIPLPHLRDPGTFSGDVRPVRHHPWDRAVEFGEGPFKCGSNVLGKSRVLRLALEGPCHWKPLRNLIERTCSSAQVFYAAVRELARSRLEGGAQAQRIWMVGDVIVTKNPCMHPGDLRKLTAVNVPQLHHVRDCIVFPVKGDRPHPEEMAGKHALPFHMHASLHRAFTQSMLDEKKIVLQVQDMIDLFCQYIKGDKIGLIANAHLVWADLLDAGINSRRCRNQARKCSVNLDFANCGDLKGLQNSQKPPMYPDFMEKQGAKNTYCSRKVLGQLYRNYTKVELSTEYLDVVENT